MVDLRTHCQLFLEDRRLRILTLNSVVRRAMLDRMSFKRVIRNGAKVQVSVVPCYDFSVRRNLPLITTRRGFLEAVIQTAIDFGMTYEVTDVASGKVVDSPVIAPFLDLRVPVQQWEANRGWQKETVQWMNSCYDGRFDVATGGGKSYLMSRICSWLPTSTVLVTDSSIRRLQDRYDDILKVCPNVGMVHGSSKQTDSRVVVCSVQCLEYVSHRVFDVFIADELHTLLTPVNLQSLATVRAKRWYGFSGSMDERSDNADLWGEAFFGPVRLQRTYQQAQSDGDVVPIRVRWLENEVPAASRGAWRVDRTVSDVLRDRDYRRSVVANARRNESFATDIRSLFDRGLQVLVLTSTTEHALRMKRLLGWPVVARPPLEKRRQVLMRLGLLKPKELSSNQEVSDLQAAFERREIRGIIANCIWHVGTDFRSLDVLARMDGMASQIKSTQLPGRLSRSFPGKTCGILIDSVDRLEGEMTAATISRRDSYRQRGWLDVTEDELASGLFGS